MHTYIHTSYLPTYLHTYIHTYIHSYMHTCIHTYIPTYLQTAYIPGRRGDTRGASIQPDAAPDVQPRLRGCEGPHEQPRGAGADVLTRVQLHRRASVSACNQRSPPATTHPQTPHRSSLSRAAAIHRLLLQGACAFSLFPRKSLRERERGRERDRQRMPVFALTLDLRRGCQAPFLVGPVRAIQRAP